MTMVTVDVYDLYWNGLWSNAVTIGVVLIFGCFIAFFLYKIVQGINSLRTDPSGRGQWARALGFLVFWIPMLLLSALLGAKASSGSGGAANAAEGPGSKGALDGFNSNLKPSQWLWLAISLFAFPLFSYILIKTTYFEQPLQLRISPTRIDLLYRLPWRDWSIPMADVTSVKLRERKYYDRSMGSSHFYTLTIEHDGYRTNVWCSQIPRYEHQIRNAYAEIEKNILPEHGK